MKPISRQPRIFGQIAAIHAATFLVTSAAPLYQWKFDGSVGTPSVTSGGGTLVPNGTANFAATGVSGVAGDNAFSVTNAYTGGTGAGNSASAGGANVLTGVGTLSRFTVTMWVNLTTGDLTNFPRLLQLGNNATPDNNNPGISLLVNNGGLEVGVNSYKNTVPAGFGAGAWKFIAFSYDGTTTNPYFSAGNNGLYGVANNAVVLTGSPTTGVAVTSSTGLNTGAPTYGIVPGTVGISSTATLYLGNRADGARGFTGLMDDVRIYNTQLTIAELEAVRLESAPPPPAGGTPFYWKGGTSTAWNATNWTSDAAGTTVSPLPADGSAAATFAATGPANMGTTVLAANQNVKSLHFNTQSTAVGIGGSHDLTIGEAGVTLDADAGTAVIDTTGHVVLGANQAWTNKSAFPFTVASAVSGAFTLTTAGPGVTVLSGANTHPATSIVSGTLKLGNTLALGPVTTSVDAGGGTLDLNGFNPEIAHLTGTTLGNINNTAEGISTLTLNTPDLAADSFSGHLNNGSATQIVALVKKGPGTQTLNATGNFTGNVLVSEGTLRASTGFNGAPAATNLGNAQTTGRTVTVAGGASLQFTINNVLGNQAGNPALLPEFILDGGTLNASRYNLIGNVTLNGGILSNSTSEAGPNYYGYQFKGDITAGGAGNSLITTSVGKGNHLSAETRFTVGENSALTVSAPLLNQSGDFANAAGGLSKHGTGTLILSGANTYTGSTRLWEGTLGLASAASLSDTSPLLVLDTAVGALELNFTGSETVGDFVIEGISPGPGTYGAMDSSADHKYPWITGTGLIVVPVADPFLPWIETFYPAPDANGAKTADPDHDGLTNLQEFAFDSLPNNGTPSGKTRSRIETISGAQALVITFPVRAGAVFTGAAPATATVAADKLTYTVAGSNNLGVFDQPVTEITASTAGLPDPDAGWTYRSFRLDGNIGGITPRGPAGFLRAGVAQQP